jgi:hypothetical protein
MKDCVIVIDIAILNEVVTEEMIVISPEVNEDLIEIMNAIVDMIKDMTQKDMMRGGTVITEMNVDVKIVVQGRTEERKLLWSLTKLLMSMIFVKFQHFDNKNKHHQ